MFDRIDSSGQFHQHFLSAYCLTPKIIKPKLKHMKAAQLTFVQKTAKNDLEIYTRQSTRLTGKNPLWIAVNFTNIL